METMNRHKLREIAMTSLYQHLLLNKDIRECVYENAESNEIDQFLYTITMDTVKYKDAYIKKISEHLSSEWTFDRLGYVEQAILLMACCEIDLEIVPKPIVVDEAVTLAKKYCDEPAYRLINGVLDQLCDERESLHGQRHREIRQGHAGSESVSQQHARPGRDLQSDQTSQRTLVFYAQG